ncbi:MAG TPA: TatD family hydrolase [Candidatus Dormibacteraeota bacterium]|nr:TatD family hydrolase [Candidatus Dormibacteraeota bacterium]
MQIVDSHCHIHSPEYEFDINQVYQSAHELGVDKFICIGTDLADSRLAVNFAISHDNTWSSVGIHPHEADKFNDRQQWAELTALASMEKVVAIGECGLDYHYNHSSKKSQREILEFQMNLAVEQRLPMSFHVRDAFDDFWPIFDNFRGVRGVLHSFTDSVSNLSKAIDRGLFIGVNGISTFTKDQSQIDMYKQIPLANLILETDAPYLTPAPFRGMMCEPKHIKVIADFLVGLRGETLEDIVSQTTKNVNLLFRI